VHERQKIAEEELNSKFLGGFFLKQKRKGVEVVGRFGWLAEQISCTTHPSQRKGKEERVSVHEWI
jgi:hypothetical protein